MNIKRLRTTVLETRVLTSDDDEKKNFNWHFMNIFYHNIMLYVNTSIDCVRGSVCMFYMLCVLKTRSINTYEHVVDIFKIVTHR